MNSDLEVIERLAEELGVGEEARRKWRVRGHVPYRWRLPLLNLAQERGLSFSQASFETFQPAAPTAAE